MGGSKYLEALEVEFYKRIEGPKPHKYEEGYCESKQYVVINRHNIHESLELSQQEVLAKIANWMSEASGWVVNQVRRHYVNISKYNPLEGSSYIELPPELRNSKYVINIKNDDNQFFRWCHIRRFNQQEKNPQQIKKSDKLMVDKLDYTVVEFSVRSKHYSRIEAHNKVNINVLEYQNKQFFPVYISTGGYEELNLLLISDGENNIMFLSRVSIV